MLFYVFFAISKCRLTNFRRDSYANKFHNFLSRLRTFFYDNMIGEESTLADEYVQGFVLDQFDDVNIKREELANVANHPPPSTNNNNDEEINQNVVQPAPPQFQRLPPMPLPIASPMIIQSPPHHLLTPPEHENYHHHSLHHHHHHHQVVNSSTKLIMYQNIPGTPPDTPPVSNSPSPQGGYMEHQPHYPHIQQVPKNVGYNEMLWQPKPLDLRPNCNGDNVAEIQNWNVMQQHTSVIASNGKRFFHTDYIHHRQQLIQNQSSSPFGKPLVCNSGLISPASTSSRTNSVSGRSTSRNNMSNGNDCSIDDDTLVTLSVRDLNLRLKSYPRDEVVKLKQKRRTLKNRGYAQNCRSKRVLQKTELELNNRKLETEINTYKMKLQEALQELDMYKRRYENIIMIESANRNSRRPGVHTTNEYL